MLARPTTQSSTRYLHPVERIYGNLEYDRTCKNARKLSRFVVTTVNGMESVSTFEPERLVLPSLSHVLYKGLMYHIRFWISNFL